MNCNLIAAVIVTYNPDEDIFVRQINSLLSEVDYIIFVDNASDNINSLETILNTQFADYFKAKIFLLKNIENFGLGKSQNIGIDFAISLNSDDLLILDHDSIIDFGFCTNLLNDRRKLVEQGLKIGAIGPIYYNEITNEIYPITKFYGPFIERIKIDSLPKEATFIIASGSLISVKNILIIGKMNEELFIDYVDVDWCFRSKNLGFGIYVSPTAKMKHVIGDKRGNFFGRTISIHSPLRRYYLTRNSIFMLKASYIPFGYKLRESVLNSFRIIVLLVTQNEKRKYLNSFIFGFKDGLQNNFGKCKRPL